MVTGHTSRHDLASTVLFGIYFSGMHKNWSCCASNENEINFSEGRLVSGEHETASRFSAAIEA